MFNNTGEKIKIIAYVVFVLGIFGAIIGGIIIMNPISVVGKMSGDAVNGVLFQFFIGILTIIFGAISSYVVALLIYGFGVIVEKAEYSDSLQICEECGKTSRKLIDCEVHNGKRWVRKNLCADCYKAYSDEGK